MRKLKLLVSPVGLVAILALVVAIYGLQLSRGGDEASPASAVPAGLPTDFATLSEVWSALQKRHLDRESLSSEGISQGAIRGMLRALDDPHAAYLTPEQYAIETADFSGHFSGIGAEVTMKDGRIMILSALPDTPAEAAGLRPGDIVLSIDGENTDGVSLREAVQKIRGPQGASVELLILHRNAGEPVTITVIRDNIQVRSVKFRSLRGGIGHLAISSFTNSTEKEVVEAIETFKRRKDQALILDLRNNPGGLLNATVNVASQFIDEGLIVYELSSDGVQTNWEARPGGVATDIPMVVLMNEFSASGSEVLIGALKDHNRASTIGVTTFGKGSVSTLHQLSDGSGIYFTVARWYTPRDTLIEDEGIEPDIVVRVDDDDEGDPQLERAMEAVRGLIVRS